MTTEARVNLIETQLQQLGSNLVTLSTANISNATHIAALIDATAANTRAMSEMHAAITELRQATVDLVKALSALEGRVAQIEAKLEERTDTILAAIDRGFEPLQNQITGLQTEMQRVLEILGQLQQGN